MIQAVLIEQLLTTNDKATQQAVLKQAGLWNAAGLRSIVEYTEARLQSNAQQSATLLEIIAELGDSAEFSAISATATWLLALYHAQNAAFPIAIKFAEHAHVRFLATNQPLQAIRTSLIQIAAFTEQGQTNAALQVAEQMLTALRPYHSNEAVELQANILQNRGMSYASIGNHSNALADYAAAGRLYKKAGNAVRQSDIVKNRGVTLLGLGQATEALALFKTAAHLLDESSQPLRHGRTLNNIGYAQLLLGQYKASLANLGAAIRVFEQAGFVGYGAIARLDSADVYLIIGLLPEAIQHYQTAIKQFSATKMAHQLLRAQHGLGTALFAAGQYKQAQSTLELALNQAENLNNVSLHADILLELAAIFTFKTRFAGANMLAQSALELAETNALPLQHVQAALQLFDLALVERDLPTAQHYLNSAVAINLQLPHINYRLELRRGKLYLAERELLQAEDHFRAAIKIIEQLRGNLRQEVLRIAFMSDKLDAHEALIGILLEQGLIKQALEITERAKSRTLVDMMGQMIEQPISGTQFDSAEKITAIRQALNALYNQLLDDSSEQRGTLLADKSAAIHARAVQLEQEIRHLQLQPSTQTDLLEQASPTTIVKLTMPETSFIAYHILGDELLAFVQVAGRLHVKRQICSVAIVRKLLTKWQVHLRRLRTGGRFVQRNLAQLTRTADRILHDFYHAIFAPLDALLPTSTPQPLLIIPHGELHHVPIHALFDGNHYLLDRFIISYMPSLTVNQLIPPQPQHVNKSPTAAIFGVSDPSLHAVVRETQQISQKFSHAKLFVDEQATFAAFAKQTQSDIVHIATHGIHRAEHPAFSGFKLHDQWVSATDIHTLRFNHSMVVISACESGRSQVRRSDESLGLARSFLAAGASSLIVSLWLVQDDISAEMMPYFYDQLQQGHSRSTALRATQRHFKKQYPHPYYWAAFVLLGKY